MTAGPAARRPGAPEPRSAGTRGRTPHLRREPLAATGGTRPRVSPPSRPDPEIMVVITHRLMPDGKPLKEKAYPACEMARQAVCHTQKPRQNNHIPPASWPVFYLALPPSPSRRARTAEPTGSGKASKPRRDRSLVAAGKRNEERRRRARCRTSRCIGAASGLQRIYTGLRRRIVAGAFGEQRSTAPGRCRRCWRGGERSDARCADRRSNRGNLSDSLGGKPAPSRRIGVGAAGTRIIGGEHERDVTISVPHHAQIGCTRMDVRARIEGV